MGERPSKTLAEFHSEWGRGPALLCLTSSWKVAGPAISFWHFQITAMPPLPHVLRRLWGAGSAVGTLGSSGCCFPQLPCVIELGGNASVDQQEVLLVSDTGLRGVAFWRGVCAVDFLPAVFGL